MLQREGFENQNKGLSTKAKMGVVAAALGLVGVVGGLVGYKIGYDRGADAEVQGLKAEAEACRKAYARDIIIPMMAAPAIYYSIQTSDEGARRKEYGGREGECEPGELPGGM